MVKETKREKALKALREKLQGKTDEEAMETVTYEFLWYEGNLSGGGVIPHTCRIRYPADVQRPIARVDGDTFQTRSGLDDAALAIRLAPGQSVQVRKI